jgi:putative ATP-binding cassette transporter
MTGAADIDTERFLKRAWRLACPYWGSSERLMAWVLLAASVGLTLFMVWIDVLFNTWQKDFYNALEEKNETDFWALLAWFCLLAAVMITAAVYQQYLQRMLEMRWRAWLTARYTMTWLDHNTFYRLELDRGTDNPDQRITEDVRTFTSGVLNLSLGLLNAVVTLVSFIGILWIASGPLSVAVGGMNLVIPGYMVWAALVYAMAGSAITWVLGRPLVRLSNEQQAREADFRFGLMRLRENAEGIALYRGSSVERTGSERLFGHVLTNWWDLIRTTKRLRFFTIGYAQVAIVFPFWVAAGRYFSGQVTLGQLMQISSAFDKVRESLSWFVTTYAELAAWKASVDRLLGFHDAVAAARAAQQHAGLTIQSNDRARAISGTGVTIQLPDGRTVLEPTDFTLSPGQRVLLTGASGSGKSTFFRALSGIWPFAGREIELPATARMLFLPQKPYMPVGSLRAALAYPEAADRFDDKALLDALDSVHLAHLSGALDDERNWSLQLSPGEQQRLAIARAVLIHPDWLFLDEATASLDESTEAAMYELLQAKLPQATLLSIAHRPQVARYHERYWHLASGRLQII